jgi:diguanylate cyclase (GGDEF)-like protein
MVTTIHQLNQQILARLGLPTHVKGEALWEMLPTTDWVTGLENRTSFLQEVRKQMSRSKRYHRPFCCLLVRIDNYNLFHSQLAPEVMEEMLSDVAGWLEMCIRDSDMLARIQHDTFGMLLPETDHNNVQHVVQRVHSYLGNFQFAHSLPEPLAFSVGVSSFADEMVSLDSLLSLAQEDLHAHTSKTAEPS